MSEEVKNTHEDLNVTTGAEPVTDEIKSESAKPKFKLGEGFEWLEVYYQKNKKAIQYIGGGIIAIAAGVVYFFMMYLPEKEKEASNEIFWAQQYFEKDSFQVALKGGKMVLSADGQKSMMGFEQIMDEYSLTKTGKLAAYYAGVCHLRLGNFERAIECLKKYSLNDEFVGPMAIGLCGDASMELGKTDDAIAYYLKAADKKRNDFTSPFFLKKAAFACELKKDYNRALELYEQIEKEYYGTEIGKEIEKEIARVKTLANLW
ncbi:MAG: tetratricopeptide repeat protein [Bacteroidia bacterium]|nr:tetratricopeptide repeat protein [Bacteroidia bacterium]